MTSLYVQQYMGTRWSDTGASFIKEAAAEGKTVELLVTAPPRDSHELSETSRILRILDVGTKIKVWLSHR